MSFTVGFDLDMTLIDPRAGIVEVFDALAAETGIPLDGRAFVTRLGPPLQHELARYRLDDSTVEHLVRRYRELTPQIAIPRTVALPGAVDAVRAVALRGGRAVVVTGKFAP
ncbi:MAG TPA: haloacid dehalogenase-like hydrolase, partial [Nakamurella sp.]